MSKNPHAQAQRQRGECQPPAGWKVQPEGEPVADRSPAEAGSTEERHGLLAPFQAGEAWPASCPLAARVSQVLSLSCDLQRAMRRLRRELKACRTCPLGENCRCLSYFHEQVNAAITEVNAEWGMP